MKRHPLPRCYVRQSAIPSLGWYVYDAQVRPVMVEHYFPTWREAMDYATSGGAR